MSKELDPYAALRFKEFNIFLGVRFAMVFAWSMQFIVIEWQVYSMTKDPLSLGIIGLMEVIPAVGMALSIFIEFAKFRVQMGNQDYFV